MHARLYIYLGDRTLHLTRRAELKADGLTGLRFPTAEALRRHLLESGEKQDHRAWAGAFSTNTPMAPKRSNLLDPERSLGPEDRTQEPAYLAGPNLLPIQALHRHDNGFISFVVKQGHHDWHQVVSIRGDALDTYFPQFTQELVRDSLVSLNASFCALGTGPEVPYGRPLHRMNTLKYLNACYVDLDYYRLGLERWHVLAELARLEAAQTIPPITLKVDTGHGMWALWLLHDPENPAKSHHGARADDLQVYAKVNRALQQRLTHLGADSVPSAVTHVRMDGSERSEYSCCVRWDVSGVAGRNFSYELARLASFLGVVTVERSPQEARAISQVSGQSKARSRAWVQTNQSRLVVLTTLMDARAGGFSEGSRHSGAFYYALALRAVGVQMEQALVALLNKNRDFSPRLGEDECAHAVKQAYRKQPNGQPRRVLLSYQRLADDLDVSPHEAQVISQAIGGKPFPASCRFGHVQQITDAQGRDTPEVRASARQAAILKVVRELQNGNASTPSPAYRAMADMLREQYGIEASHMTVRSDYAVLGLSTRRRGQIQAARRSRTAQIPLLKAS